MSTPAAAPLLTPDPTELLANPTLQRLVLRARLAPVAGDRFQPAGFPEVGHVIYDAPRADQTIEKVCILDSAASMANHLESVCFAGSFSSDLHPDIARLPFVQCWTDGGGGKALSQLVATSLSEGHRLASKLFTDGQAVCVDGEAPSEKSFRALLLERLGLRDLESKTHPLPTQWWQVFKAIFALDPNSLVHGILFPDWGIKLSRMLSAQHEALGANRVLSSGVKFDRLDTGSSVQPIFSVDEETAREIRATFVIDLALLRSFGHGDEGLGEPEKAMLLEFALWKVGRLLASPFRFRSNCDLRTIDLLCVGASANSVDPGGLGTGVTARIAAAYGNGPREPVTRVFRPLSQLFKTDAESKKKKRASKGAGAREGQDGDQDTDGEEDGD